MSKRIRSTDPERSAPLRQLWLAGLGAVSIARQQAESLFGQLVAEGRQIQQRTLRTADTLAGDVRKQADGVLSSLRNRASQQAQRAVDLLGEGVSRTLNRLGVPSREDIRELSARVAELNRKVGQASRGESA